MEVRDSGGSARRHRPATLDHVQAGNGKFVDRQATDMAGSQHQAADRQAADRNRAQRDGTEGKRPYSQRAGSGDGGRERRDRPGRSADPGG